MRRCCQVIFKEAAARGTVGKYFSLFPGLGFGAGYKILQRVYKFGGQVSALQKYVFARICFCIKYLLLCLHPVAAVAAGCQILSNLGACYHTAVPLLFRYEIQYSMKFFLLLLWPDTACL